MPTNLQFTVPNPANQATQAVYVRATWGAAWTQVANLHCDSLTWSASPSIGAASFSYRYGVKLDYQSAAWQAIARFAPNPRSYVKVEVTLPNGGGLLTWLGIWRQATDTGLHQRFTADGIEALLSYSTVRNSVYYDVFGAVKQSECGLTFNEHGKPNRSQDKQPVRTQNAYVFDADPERATYWSSRDIVEYLLAAHPPVRANDTTIFTWTLLNPDRIPDYDRPTLPTHGKDVLGLVQSVVSRFRLLSFRTQFVPASAGTGNVDIVYIEPFTFTDADIELTDIAGNPAAEIPANPDTFSLDFRFDPSSQASLTIQANHVADKVTVIGGRRLSVFSVSNTDVSLERGWEKKTEDEYREAENTLVGDLPATTERRARQEMIAQFRGTREYQHVYTRYQIPKYWDQEAYNGEFGGGGNPIAVDDNDDQFQIPQHLLFVEPDLPFLTGYDYRDGKIAALVAEDGHRGDKTGEPPHEPLPILVALKMTDDSDRWINLEAVGQLSTLEQIGIDEGAGAAWSEVKTVANSWTGTVRALREVAGVEINVQGEQNHILAHTEFNAPTGPLPNGRDDKRPGAFKWQETIFTIAVGDPRQIVVSYPDPPTPIGELVNEKVLEVGEEYLMIRVLPGTVVGVSGVGDLIRTDGGLLQDDRDFLKLLAQRAYEWHRVPRYALTFSTGLITGWLNTGDYVTSLRDGNVLLAVGSVVTEVTLEMPKAKGAKAPPMRISYATAFAELDPTKFL